MLIPAEVLDQCLRNDHRGQELFYKAYAPRMFGLCLRYASNRIEAEDILQEGFIKVFQNLGTLQSSDSLDAWVRRIMVNTALNYYSKQLKFQNDTSLKFDIPDATISDDALSKLSYNELLRILQGLPTGYRTVFNLFVIEGYSHREIGELLDISINTSKSQLFRAKAYMQKILKRIL